MENKRPTLHLPFKSAAIEPEKPKSVPLPVAPAARASAPIPTAPRPKARVAEPTSEATPATQPAEQPQVSDTSPSKARIIKDALLDVLPFLDRHDFLGAYEFLDRLTTDNELTTEIRLQMRTAYLAVKRKDIPEAEALNLGMDHIHIAHTNTDHWQYVTLIDTFYASNVASLMHIFHEQAVSNPDEELAHACHNAAHELAEIARALGLHEADRVREKYCLILDKPYSRGDGHVLGPQESFRPQRRTPAVRGRPPKFVPKS